MRALLFAVPCPWAFACLWGWDVRYGRAPGSLETRVPRAEWGVASSGVTRRARERRETCASLARSTENVVRARDSCVRPFGTEAALRGSVQGWTGLPVRGAPLAFCGGKRGKRGGGWARCYLSAGVVRSSLVRMHLGVVRFWTYAYRLSFFARFYFIFAFAFAFTFFLSWLVVRFGSLGAWLVHTHTDSPSTRPTTAN